MKFRHVTIYDSNFLSYANSKVYGYHIIYCLFIDNMNKYWAVIIRTNKKNQTKLFQWNNEVGLPYFYTNCPKFWQSPRIYLYIARLHKNICELM